MPEHRSFTVGTTRIVVDRPLQRTEDQHGVRWQLNEHEALHCTKLVVYPGEGPIDEPDWSIVHDDACDLWVAYPSGDTIVQMIGRDEMAATEQHVRRTKTNPVA